jgi:hypothetical protein
MSSLRFNWLWCLSAADKALHHAAPHILGVFLIQNFERLLAPQKEYLLASWEETGTAALYTNHFQTNCSNSVKCLPLLSGCWTCVPLSLTVKFWRRFFLFCMKFFQNFHTTSLEFGYRRFEIVMLKYVFIFNISKKDGTTILIRVDEGDFSD